MGITQASINNKYDTFLLLCLRNEVLILHYIKVFLIHYILQVKASV